MDRRSFLNTLSASAILTAAPAIASTPGRPVPASRSRISLNGEWEHFVDGNDTTRPSYLLLAAPAVSIVCIDVWSCLVWTAANASSFTLKP